MTATTGTISVLRDSTVIAANVVPFTFEIICMTGGTVGRVLGPGPGDVTANGITMAPVTARVSPVVARVVSIRIMIKVSRRPAVGGMTHVALFCRGQMASRFKGCTAARRVTGIAVTDTAGVVRPAAADESSGGMTGGAVQAGRNVRGHGIHHADCRIAIMTRDAIVDDTGMIERRRNKAAGRVTDATILIGRNMVDFFRRGETGIVTGHAIIDDTCMIEECWQKARGLVTVDAIAIGGHVTGFLALRRSAIVTGPTAIGDALVFKRGIGEGRRIMAHRAVLAADRNMVRIGLGRSTGCDGSIVTGHTVVDDTCVIEHCRRKGTPGHVTDAAILGSRDVGSGRVNLTGRIGAVVAGIATDGQHGGIGVVDIECGTEAIGVMTTAAIDVGNYVPAEICRLAAGSQGICRPVGIVCPVMA